MRITWVTRSFLDYRIPVYEEINRLCGNQLTVIYFSDVVPQRCQDKLKSILGKQAKGLTGELRLGGKKIENQAYANTGWLRIPLRPGLTRILKKTNPDIILSDGFFQWTYAALFANFLWQIPHIMCYERTLHTERNVSIIRTIGRKIAMKFINAICCNGIQTKKYLLNLGYPTDQLFLGNMSADSKEMQKSVAAFKPKVLSALKTKYNIAGPIFLYAGQLIPRKGIIELLSAWKEFSEKNPEPKLLLIGGGEQQKQTIEFVHNENIKGVKILGNVDYSDMAGFYAMADIFIIATLEDNWSLVVPEAMSCGLPIICSQYNGCWPELVKPENGWVFDPLDYVNFINTLNEAWDKRSNWEEMGQQSLRIVQDFTPEKVAQNIYSACLKVTGTTD